MRYYYFTLKLVFNLYNFYEPNLCIQSQNDSLLLKIQTNIYNIFQVDI